MSTIFWIVVAVVAVIFIILALKSFPAAKTILGVLVVMVALVAGVYSSVNLYSYYTASGGVYGELSGFFDVNKGTSEEFTFKLTNIELKQVHDDTYSATIVTDTVLELEDTDYCLFVNDMPCMVEESGVDYMIGNYTYNFYDENLELKLQDTLNLKFVFNKTYCQLSVSTEGGAEAVKLWNYYFNKNNFVVKFAKADYVPEEDLGYTEGEAPETCVVTYNVEGVESQALIPVGTQISNITYAPTKTFYNFDGWTLDGETTVNPNYTIQDDTTLIATFSLAEAGLYDNEGNMKLTWDEIISNEILGIEDGILSLNSITEADRLLMDGVLIIHDSIVGLINLDKPYLTGVFIPDSVVEIRTSAFQDCVNLEFVHMSNNVSLIGDYAFYNCTKLTSIELPDTLVTIKQYAFAGCERLTNIAIPSSVTTIGAYAFSGCALLKHIELPSRLTALKQGTFKNCLSLQSVYIPASIETVGGDDYKTVPFYGCQQTLKIYCELDYTPAGDSAYWLNVDMHYSATLYLGYTYEEYLAEIQ